MFRFRGPRTYPRGPRRSRVLAVHHQSISNVTGPICSSCCSGSPAGRRVYRWLPIRCLGKCDLASSSAGATFTWITIFASSVSDGFASLRVAKVVSVARRQSDEEGSQVVLPVRIIVDRQTQASSRQSSLGRLPAQEENIAVRTHTSDQRAEWMSIH